VDARESVGSSVDQQVATAGASRRESIRAAACAVAAIVLSLGAVAGIHSIVDDDGSETTTRLAVGQSAGASSSDGHGDHHDDQSQDDDGPASRATGASKHASDDHAAAHDEQGGHGHGDDDDPDPDFSDDDDFDVSDDDDHAHDDGNAHDVVTAGSHGHTSGGSSGTAPSTSGHGHGPAAPGPAPSAGHSHSPPPSGGGTTTPTTGHHHPPPSPPPTGGGTTTPTTSGHHPPPPPNGPVQLADLPADIRAQVTSVRDWALRYPTAQSARAAGYQQATVFFHGIAAHYMNYSLLDATFDPARPEVLLYGEQGQLVGVNYIVYSGASPPAGFSGDLDHWHEHPALCRSNSSGLVIAGEETSAAQCAAMGGTQISFAGYYLLHVWCIPGWESPEGIFSHENSRV
jgi:hypothetical protein